MAFKIVAVYGGSFDPPTKAHIDVAKGILGWASLRVDEVWMMPCFTHPFGKEMLRYEDRLMLCSIAASGEKKIVVSDFESVVAKRWSAWDEGSTIKTAMNLIGSYDDTMFRFIIGMDCAIDFHKWKHYEDLQGLVTFIVVPRQGYVHDPDAWYMKGKAAIVTEEGKVTGWKPRHDYLPGLVTGEMSSTKVHEALQSWTDRTKDSPAPLKEWVDPMVLECIAEKGFYLPK